METEELVIKVIADRPGYRADGFGTDIDWIWDSFTNAKKINGLTVISIERPVKEPDAGSVGGF